MADSIQVAAFEGGSLRIYATGEKSGEAVLALPLSRLIVKMLRIPAENREDPVAYATPILKSLSPYPDDPLTVSCETVRESENAVIAIAAALPESATDDIAEALDAAKLNVTRVDALALGGLRGLWPRIAAGGETAVRRLVLVAGVDCISLFVLDGESPSAIRAVSAAGDLRREAMLSLLEAEDFGGARALAEVVAVGEVANVDSLSAFAPVRKIEPGDPDQPLAGVAERSAETGTLDALPDSWREVLGETRFKRKLVKGMTVAGVIWGLAVAVLFGVPIAYGFMTDHQKNMCKEHQKQYRAVAEMRDKVKLVRKYSDHSRGALEILKAVSDRLPQGIELTSWNFKREDGVKVSGEADSANLVYDFKDEMDDTTVFANVILQGPSAGKGGKHKFDLDCQYEKEEE